MVSDVSNGVANGVICAVRTKRAAAMVKRLPSVPAAQQQEFFEACLKAHEFWTLQDACDMAGLRKLGRK